jgi:mycoredoxin
LVALPITVYGTTECEDTAHVVGRLNAWGVPFQWVDIDRDEPAERFVIAVNGGYRSTPTLLASDGKLRHLLTEPDDAQLEVFLRLAGQR